MKSIQWTATFDSQKKGTFSVTADTTIASLRAHIADQLNLHPSLFELYPSGARSSHNLLASSSQLFPFEDDDELSRCDSFLVELDNVSSAHTRLVSAFSHSVGNSDVEYRRKKLLKVARYLSALAVRAQLVQSVEPPHSYAPWIFGVLVSATNALSPALMIPIVLPMNVLFAAVGVVGLSWSIYRERQRQLISNTIQLLLQALHRLEVRVQFLLSSPDSPADPAAEALTEVTGLLDSPIYGGSSVNLSNYIQENTPLTELNKIYIG